MIDERQDQERADRDRERSEEAHWQAAEAAAEEEEERVWEIARQSEWENEGGGETDFPGSIDNPGGKNSP